VYSPDNQKIAHINLETRQTKFHSKLPLYSTSVFQAFCSDSQTGNLYAFVRFKEFITVRVFDGIYDIWRYKKGFIDSNYRMIKSVIAIPKFDGVLIQSYYIEDNCVFYFYSFQDDKIVEFPSLHKYLTGPNIVLIDNFIIGNYPEPWCFDLSKYKSYVELVTLIPSTGQKFSFASPIDSSKESTFTMVPITL
jgi:hypothetical protein